VALDILAWHDRTTSDHQTQWTNARAAGYSTLSMCLYGDAGDPRFAVSMVRRATQAQEELFLNLTEAMVQSTFNLMAGKGWGPQIITATGSTGSPVFAALFSPASPIPYTRVDISPAEFAGINSDQQINGNLILRWADVYGDSNNLRYIGIWVLNADNRGWNSDGIDDSDAVAQQRFNAMVSGFARPVLAVSTPDKADLMVYDDSEMPNWQAWGAMTSAQYQARFDALYPQGFRPIRVSAKGSATDARFNVIFAGSEDAEVRSLRVSTPPSGSALVPAIDSAMQDIMTADMIRGASLSILSGTRLVYAQGYTFAEPGYPDVQAGTMFRQASVSKLFTAAALYQLMDEGAKLPGTNTALTLDTPLFEALPNILTAWSGDWRVFSITIRHLLEMTSGINPNILGSDPLVSSTLPIGPTQLAQWVVRQPLINDPGDPNSVSYSNAGYMLLGLVVARMRGAQDFLSGLSTFLTRLNIIAVRSAATVAAWQAPDEARYHSRPLTELASVMFAGQPWCAQGYGEWNLENLGGGGGLSASAPAVARVVAALSCTFNNPMMSPTTINNWLQNAINAWANLGPATKHGFHGFDRVEQDSTTGQITGEKGGELSTSQNGLRFTLHGISTVICWNGMTLKSDGTWFPVYQRLMDLANAQDWGTVDLFPMFGMPPLPVPPTHPLPRPIPRPPL
jgi:hypothetical protein